MVCRNSQATFQAGFAAAIMVRYQTVKLFQTFVVMNVLATMSSAFAAPRLSLRADRDSQIVQNERADRDQLSRIDDDSTLQRYARLQLLSPVPEKTRGYYIHNVPPQYRYLRPWTKLFLDRLSSQFQRRFRKPLRVTSLTRTAAYQKSLRRGNGNAAAPYGKKRSVHLTGACVDVSKKNLRSRERSWMRTVLASLREKGYLFPIEEFSQPNFHVMVYRNYPEYVAKQKARGR